MVERNERLCRINLVGEKPLEIIQEQDPKEERYDVETSDDVDSHDKQDDPYGKTEPSAAAGPSMWAMLTCPERQAVSGRKGRLPRWLREQVDKSSVA